jgi:hypothetical protein
MVEDDLDSVFRDALDWAALPAAAGQAERDQRQRQTEGTSVAAKKHPISPAQRAAGINLAGHFLPPDLNYALLPLIQQNSSRLKSAILYRDTPCALKTFKQF